MSLRVAVVTAVYKPNLDWLRQCHDSVRAQQYPCTHLMVSDGSGPNPMGDFQGQFIELRHNHSDWGDSPRALGSLSAFGQGFDAVAWLDQDNWLEPNHIRTLIELQLATQAPVCVSRRNLHALDSRHIGLCPESDGVDFADLNTYLMTRAAFTATQELTRMPARFHTVGDCWLWLRLPQLKLKVACTGQATVAYRSPYPGHYQRFSLPVPEACKGREHNDNNVRLLIELQSRFKRRIPMLDPLQPAINAL